jgi:hypothetical protein
MMQFTFSELSAKDLRGRTEADVFVNVEAELQIVDDHRKIYSESEFPVVELAVALRTWKSAAGGVRSPFEFRSLSLEYRWVVRLLPIDAGWRVVADENGEFVTGSACSLAEVDVAIDNFAHSLRAKCVDLLGKWVERYFI